MQLRGILTTVPDSLPVPNDTPGEIRLLSDDGLVANISTTDGWWEYAQNGNPGPIVVNWDYAGVVKNQYSKIMGPTGPIDIGGLPLIMRVFSNGVISGLGGEMAVTATGLAMAVNVAAGGSLVQGILYDQLVAGSVTVEAAHATLARIDTLVIEVVPSGAGEDIEGRSELVMVKGTAAATPVAPTLTQTASLYQYALADVAVGAAVTVIGSDKVTTRSGYATIEIPDDSITNNHIQDSAKSILYVKESGVIQNTQPINRLNFNGSFFDVDINESFDGQQADIDLAAAENSVMAPVSEFVATGGISSGTRTLITYGVGPLPTGIPYAVIVDAGVTIRNSGTTGTVNFRCNIDGGTQRTHEFQNVGGVPRWCTVRQTATVTKSPGASFNVTASVQYVSGNTSDIRAGQIAVIAIPLNLLAGA